MDNVGGKGSHDYSEEKGSEGLVHSGRLYRILWAVAKMMFKWQRCEMVIYGRRVQFVAQVYMSSKSRFLGLPGRPGLTSPQRDGSYPTS